MGTVNENRKIWEGFDWALGGDEWSWRWGTAAAEWYGSILPRLHQWLPAETVLEIAPGFGRWTQYLKDLSRHLIVVDIAEKCIDACRNRFASASNISYFVNNGSSLAMIPDRSVDFIFSFDSLVHVEADTIEAYLVEFARTLTPDGVAFIHHSNVGTYHRRLAFGRRINTVTQMHWRLSRLNEKVKETLKQTRLTWENLGWRAESMTAELFENLACKAGLHCRSQEIIPWNKSLLTDCISVVTRLDSQWGRANVVRRNHDFSREIRYVAALDKLYRQ
jgi:ubiquinone/menaquinone biosynthesis C-methylase UbiE